MLNYIQRILVRRSEKGASAVEYGLLVALIAVGIILGVSALGGSLNTLFDDTGKCIAGTATC
jgi:pilus assembly protein Flp/PilA